MTQPDQYLPDKATNSGSFADYAAKTGDEYEDEMRGGEENRWGAGILDFLFPEGIPRDMPLPLAIITAIARQILKVPEMIWDTVTDVATEVGDFLYELWQGFGQVVDIFAGGVVTPINSAIQSVKDWFADLLGFRQDTVATQTNLQNFQISTIAAGSRNPRWVCRYAVADVTYPEVNNMILETFDDSLVNDGTAQAAYFNVPQGEALFGIIAIGTVSIHDHVGIYARKAAGSLNNVFLETHRKDQSGNWVQVSSTNITSDITETGGYVEAELSGGVIVTTDDEFLIKIRNSSSTATGVYVGGMGQMPGTIDVGGRFTTGASDTTHSAAAVTTGLANEVTMPFALIATKDGASADRSWSDDFGRINLGPLWSTKSSTGSQLGITNNRLSFKGTTDGSQNGIHIRKMGGDANLITGRIYLDPLNAGRQCGLLLHCNQDMTQVVYLAVRDAGSRIYSGDASGSLTERATDSTGGSGKWSMYYDADLDKYVVLKNDSPTGLEWTGVGSAVQHGGDYRFGGARISRSSFVNAGQIDDMSCSDAAPTDE